MVGIATEDEIYTKSHPRVVTGIVAYELAICRRQRVSFKIHRSVGYYLLKVRNNGLEQCIGTGGAVVEYEVIEIIAVLRFVVLHEQVEDSLLLLTGEVENLFVGGSADMRTCQNEPVGLLYIELIPCFSPHEFEIEMVGIEIEDTIVESPIDGVRLILYPYGGMAVFAVYLGTRCAGEETDGGIGRESDAP